MAKKTHRKAGRGRRHDRRQERQDPSIWAPQRRKDDRVTEGAKVKDRSALALMLIGLAAFLYQMADFLRSHTQAAIDYYGTPAGVGEVLFAVFCGIAAVLGALGLNVPNLVKGFVQSFHGKD